MNIFIISPDCNKSIEKLETLFNKNENKVFKIAIEGFAQLSDDYFNELPTITGNEVFNVILKQISNKQQAFSENPDLVLLDSILNFNNLDSYIRKWKNCDVYLISESDNES